MRPKNKHKNRIFLDNVLQGDVEVVKQMLITGSPVEARDNEHGETALMFAVKFDHEVITFLLLGAGADVNAKDAMGRTPLMAAKAKQVPLLLAAGAQINTQDENGETALMKASAAADTDKATVLLEKGADRTIRDHDNRNAWNRADDLGISVLTELLKT